jgi:hypothetical protein
VEVVQEEERVQVRGLIVSEGALEANAGAFDRGLTALDCDHGSWFGHAMISVTRCIIGFDLRDSVCLESRVCQGEYSKRPASRNIKNRGLKEV